MTASQSTRARPSYESLRGRIGRHLTNQWTRPCRQAPCRKCQSDAGRAHMKRKRPLIYATSGRPRASRLHPNQPIIMLAVQTATGPARCRPANSCAETSRAASHRRKSLPFWTCVGHPLRWCSSASPQKYDASYSYRPLCQEPVALVRLGIASPPDHRIHVGQKHVPHRVHVGIPHFRSAALANL